VLTTTAGLCLWIILWAMDIKAFDAFLLTLGMIILAVTVRMILPSLPGSRPDPDEPA
jgi:Mn2+/Fe2+ NRAMP family transporter